MWATKRRYPPYINLNGGQQKDVTHPTLILRWATKRRYPPYINLNGGQQKDVTHPTLIYWGRQQKVDILLTRQPRKGF